MVFRNLIDNAIKYGGAEPAVEVDSRFAGDAHRRHADHRQRPRHSGQAAPQDLWPLRSPRQRAGTLADRHRAGAVHRPHAGQAHARQDHGPRPRSTAGHGFRSATAGHRPADSTRRCPPSPRLRRALTAPQEAALLDDRRSPHCVRGHDPTLMKHILVVEDEQHLAFGIKYNLEAEGTGDHRRRRPAGAQAVRRRPARRRPGDSRPDAARHERLRGLRDAARKGERRAGADAQCPHVGRGPHSRLRRRRRPVPAKAVRAGRAAEHDPQPAGSPAPARRPRRGARRRHRSSNSAGPRSTSTPSTSPWPASNCG